MFLKIHNMATYLKIISLVQEFMLEISIGIICLLPAIVLLTSDLLTAKALSTIYTLSLVSVSFVMAIRPLADLLPKIKWIRPLVILRKGFGVFSASIIFSFMIAKAIELGFTNYLLQYLDPAYWSLEGFKFFAHLGDLVAIPLLLTSNNLSKNLLGKNWKKLQQLAYVYFYSGAIYEALVFGSGFAVIAIILVSALVISAYFFKLLRKENI